MPIPPRPCPDSRMGCAFAFDRDAYAIAARLHPYVFTCPRRNSFAVCWPVPSIDPRATSKYNRCDISGLNPIESKHGRFALVPYGAPRGNCTVPRALTREPVLRVARHVADQIFHLPPITVYSLLDAFF